MYSFSKCLENVYKYQAKNNSLVRYHRNNTSLYFNDVLISNDVHIFIFDGFYLIFSTVNEEIKKTDITNPHLIKILKKYHTMGDRIYSKNEILIDNELTNERLLYNFESETIVQILDTPPTFIDNKRLFLRQLSEPTIFKSLSLETGEYLWETNITIEGDTDPRIKQVLGISGDVLVVFTFGSTLVGIDVHTGEILWSILPKGFYPLGFTGMAWCWHLEDGYLYLLRHQYYLRINLSNQQLEVLWQTPADTLEFEDCCYTEDHIYFMAIDKKSNIFNTSILGVFDRKALKIVWQYDQPIYSSQPPQSDGNKLYCLDTGGTLHIFEREKLNP